MTIFWGDVVDNAEEPDTEHDHEPRELGSLRRRHSEDRSARPLASRRHAVDRDADYFIYAD